MSEIFTKLKVWFQSEFFLSMFLSKISIHSSVVTHYIVEENIFVVIVYKLLEYDKYWNDISKITLRLMAAKELRWLQRLNTSNWKITRKKVTIYDLCRFPKCILPEDNGKQNPNESYTSKYQKHVVCSFWL